MDGFDVPTREQASCMDDCAEVPHEVPQWRTPKGPRYVIVRALTAGQRRQAEQAATVRRADKSIGVDDYLLMIEEVRRGIVRPRDLTRETLEGWNADVVLAIYSRLQTLGHLPPAEVAARLAAIAGPVPPPAGGARVADDVLDGGDAGGGAAHGDDPGGAAGAADG